MPQGFEDFERADYLVRDVLQLWQSFTHVGSDVPPHLERLLVKAWACQQVREKADCYRYRKCLTPTLEAVEEQAVSALIRAYREFVSARRKTWN